MGFKSAFKGLIHKTLESQNTTILYYLYIQRMMVTANQLHVSASNRPSSGCTSKEKGSGLYNIQCDFYLMTRSRSSYDIHLHYSQVNPLNAELNPIC